MEQHLKDRILRRLEHLPDERAYQVLDFIEFLDSKYSGRSNPDNIFTRFSEKVEDTMRAGKLPVDAIAGTVNLFDGASKVMRGVASAAQSVVDEASKAAKGVTGDKKSGENEIPDKVSPPDSEGGAP